jgi:cytoskeletal protein RodZ
MAEAVKRELRGYDSYRVSLGDEMRGERASMGKSLLDVQRDLRIKAAHIDAIENSDPGAVPYRGFVTGYVRAYARYLGMDEETVLRRFCEESGFEPGATELASSARRTAARPARRHDIDAVIAGSRLAAASRAAAVNADLGSTLRGLGSLSVLVLLVGGIGYGGWALLQNIQRVEFAPAPESPEALAALPEFDSMTRIARASVAPSVAIDDASLAAVYAAQEIAPPRIAPRDGPISALDPALAGVYAQAAEGSEGAADAPLDPAFAAALDSVAAEGPTAPGEPSTTDGGVSGLVLVVDAEAWVRIRDAGGRVAHEALMPAGARWTLPEGATGYTLRAGNAGGVFVEVDGVRFGPLGRPGAVVSEISLDAAALSAAFPAVTRTAQGPIDATVARAQP